MHERGRPDRVFGPLSDAESVGSAHKRFRCRRWCALPFVDPPDGKIPALTEAARKDRREQFERYDDIHDRPLPERCLLGFSSTGGPPMLPALYNNNYQIVQTPDHIMILVEMVHDVRIIRMSAQHTGLRAYANGWVIRSAIGKATP